MKYMTSQKLCVLENIELFPRKKFCAERLRGSSSSGAFVKGYYTYDTGIKKSRPTMQMPMNEAVTFLLIFISLRSLHCKALTADFVVAKDGSGDFRTIAEAIEAIPSQGSRRFYVSVKSGIYYEYLVIEQKKTNITMFGDGMSKTIITGNRHAGPHFGTDKTATVAIYGDGFIAQDIAFQNTAGPQNNQSVAVLIEARYCVFYKCQFSGFQDTLYAQGGIQFFRECEIYGTVDFIFGNAAVVFQKCFVYARRPMPGQSNVITANGRAVQTENTGTVLHNCTITSAPDLRQSGPPVKTYLGRPWKTFSRTVVMQSFLDSIIDPEGWLQFQGHTGDKPFYAEYNNCGPGSDTNKRVQWEKPKVIAASEASSYTVRNFIKGLSWIPSTGIPCDLDLI